MKINHVQHIAVNTKNIAESIAFYTDIMGFPLSSRADMGDCELVYMQVGGDCYIELFDLRGSVTHQAAPETQAGLRHIAFDVDDVAGWEAFLKEKGVPFVLTATEMPQIGKRAILVLDPNNVVIELCENL